MAVKTYPTLEGWAEYAEALDSYRELVAEERALGARLGDLPKLQREAERADDTSQAEALRAGEPDPGRKATERARGEAEQTRTRLRVVRQAIAQQSEHLDQLLASETAQDMAAATREHTAGVYLEALDALTAAREAYWSARRTAAYLAGELAKPMWTAPPPRLAIGLLPNGAMVSMNGTGSAGGLAGNGEPLDPAPVFQAMREEVNPAEALEPVAGRWRTRQLVNEQGLSQGQVTQWIPDGAA